MMARQARRAGERWIEDLLPLRPGAPVHPNEAGHQAVAAAVERTLDR